MSDVDKLFSNLKNALPVFVPAMPSIQIGLIVTFIILIIGLFIANNDRKNNKESKDVVAQTRWMIIIGVSVWIATRLGEFVQNKHYTIQCISTNKQHYANVHWLKQYMGPLKM